MHRVNMSVSDCHHAFLEWREIFSAPRAIRSGIWVVECARRAGRAVGLSSLSWSVVIAEAAGPGGGATPTD